MFDSLRVQWVSCLFNVSFCVEKVLKSKMQEFLEFQCQGVLIWFLLIPTLYFSSWFEITVD